MADQSPATLIDVIAFASCEPLLVSLKPKDCMFSIAEEDARAMSKGLRVDLSLAICSQKVSNWESSVKSQMQRSAVGGRREYVCWREKLVKVIARTRRSQESRDGWWEEKSRESGSRMGRPPRPPQIWPDSSTRQAMNG